MSTKLLRALNGKTRGPFYRWLEKLDCEPRIAWYPSAGNDFRDLLFLNSQYYARNPVIPPDVPLPDIFLHTDYVYMNEMAFPEAGIVFCDGRTKISVDQREELPPLDLPLDDQIVTSSEGGPLTGKVFYLNVSVCSNLLGNFNCGVLYAMAENAAFCALCALPMDARFSHIVHVRYGGGSGGSRASGVWLMNILDRVGCEVFITDGHHEVQSGDRWVYELYPALGEQNEVPALETIRVVRGIQWSRHGDVTFKRRQGPRA